MSSFFEEFKTFALRGNAIDLAVGIVIGAAFNGVVTSLVNNIITPPLGLLTGRINFADLAVPLGGTVTIAYGLFLQAIISFLITALALFLFIRFINRVVQQERHKKPQPEDTKSPELVVLEEIRDSVKRSANTA